MENNILEKTNFSCYSSFDWRLLWQPWETLQKNVASTTVGFLSKDKNLKYMAESD